jgi:hypothetical protein
MTKSSECRKWSFDVDAAREINGSERQQIISVISKKERFTEANLKQKNNFAASVMLV